MVCVLLIIVGVGSHHRQPQAVCGGWLESAGGVNHLYQLSLNFLFFISSSKVRCIRYLQ